MPAGVRSRPRLSHTHFSETADTRRPAPAEDTYNIKRERNMMRDSDGIVIGYNTINASEHRAMPTGPALAEVRLRGRSERTANQAHGMHPRIVHSPAAAKATKRRPSIDASRDGRGRLGMEDLRNVLDRPDRWHDTAGRCSREPVPRRLWRRTRSWRRISRSNHDWIIGRAATKLETEARHTLRSTRILTVRLPVIERCAALSERAPIPTMISHGLPRTTARLRR
ncbi:hypothetical protein SAMN04490220_0797 [Rhodococcus jostii]|uniref:Uncharacterized protein n=1 Tax=Rhodococcus jostii TaxID=132919 RepID=A0A1H4JCM6_RHOJO|nr:hypothetical protein SAMN04490220_0797 [Rhodococcus jostii]